MAPAGGSSVVLSRAVADWLITRGVVTRASVSQLDDGDSVVLDDQTSARFESGAVRETGTARWGMRVGECVN